MEVLLPPTRKVRSTNMSENRDGRIEANHIETGTIQADRVEVGALDDYYTEAVEQWRKEREKEQKKRGRNKLFIFMGHVVLVMTMFWLFKVFITPLFPEAVQNGVEWSFLAGFMLGGIFSSVVAMLYEINKG